MIRASILLAMLLAARASAAPPSPPVAVVPLGSGPALAPSTAVARAIADALNARQPDRARLVYPRPELPPRPIDESKADELVATATRSYENLEFGAVRQAATSALGIYKQQIKAGGSDEGYLHTLHLLAAAALFDGDASAAFTAMNDALIFRPAPPSPKKFNPTVQKLYAEVAARSAEDHQGSLRLNAPDAVVWFNRQLHGTATGVLTLRAGLYLVEVVRPGAAPWARWFRVEAGQARELAVALKPGPAAREAPLVSALRAELERGAPGPAVDRARARFGAAELVLVATEGSCSANACGLRMSWARQGRWAQVARSELRGDPERVAGELLAATAAVPAAAGGGACSMDNQCGIAERCIDRRCRRPRSIFRKWWFWAAIGAVAAGTAVAIAVPLTRPESPVIELR